MFTAVPYANVLIGLTYLCAKHAVTVLIYNDNTLLYILLAKIFLLRRVCSVRTGNAHHDTVILLIKAYLLFDSVDKKSCYKEV